MTADVRVAIVGLGSRGLSMLERVVTLVKRHDAARMTVHVIDPTCTGAGVHELDQPDYLLLNTTAAQVSMFPDEHTVGDDVGGPGPSLFDWAVRRGLRVARDGFTVGTVEALGDGSRAIRPSDFLPRRLLGEYLSWFLHQVLQRAKGVVDVRLHRAEAVGMLREPDGTRVFTLCDGERVHAEYAFITTGYTSNVAVPSGPGGHRLVPAPYPLPAQVAAIPPRESVAIGGFGLSAMDLMSSLTVGRGGRFVASDGPLRYLPSGREPLLLFYSRSGLPCRARPRVVTFGPRYCPSVFTEAAVDRLRATRGGGALDFEADVMPLVLTEMRVAYRRCVARLAGGDAAADVEARLASASGLDGIRAVLDALDLAAGGADAPPFDARAAFDGAGDMLLDDGDAYQKWLTDLLGRDLAEGALGFTGSPVKAGLDVLRALRDTFRYTVDFGGLTGDSLEAFNRDTVPALNRAVVGPQYERHVELLALIEAGIAQAPFGPAPAVAFNAATDRWRVSSTRLSIPHVRDVDWLVRANVDLPTVDTSASRLVASMYQQGFIRPHRANSAWVRGIDLTRGYQPLDGQGRVDERLWVIGPLCEGTVFYTNLVPSPGAFSKPIHDAHECVAAMLRAATRPSP